MEVDPDIKETLTQIINQSSQSRQSAYGLLKQGRIGGALLYGPPGTGKTHLARVVAHEFETVVIAVTAADIVNSYVGETEKAIQGLFSLARMLSPSIIFIDEADSLFRQRKAEDRSWERNQTNQFLTEMDGLMRRDNSPFVLLASNFPQQLDHAVLRRAPARLYIPLPSPTARKRILAIFLREEDISPDVDFDRLANSTIGYSGSDIRSVCIHAALLAEASNNPKTNRRRMITHNHLDGALKKYARTVSEVAMSSIKAFAKDFDPSGWEKMKVIESQSRKPITAPIKPWD